MFDDSALAKATLRAAMMALLLGKPPGRSPVLPEVIERLRATGADVRVDVPRAGAPMPSWLP